MIRVLETFGHSVRYEGVHPYLQNVYLLSQPGRRFRGVSSHACRWAIVAGLPTLSEEAGEGWLTLCFDALSRAEAWTPRTYEV